MLVSNDAAIGCQAEQSAATIQEVLQQKRHAPKVVHTWCLGIYRQATSSSAK